MFGDAGRSRLTVLIVRYHTCPRVATLCTGSNHSNNVLVGRALLFLVGGDKPMRPFLVYVVGVVATCVSPECHVGVTHVAVECCGAIGKAGGAALQHSTRAQRSEQATHWRLSS